MDELIDVGEIQNHFVAHLALIRPDNAENSSFFLDITLGNGSLTCSSILSITFWYKVSWISGLVASTYEALVNVSAVVSKPASKNRTAFISNFFHSNINRHMKCVPTNYLGDDKLFDFLLSVHRYFFSIDFSLCFQNSLGGGFDDIVVLLLIPNNLSFSSREIFLLLSIFFYLGWTDSVLENIFQNFKKVSDLFAIEYIREPFQQISKSNCWVRDFGY